MTEKVQKAKSSIPLLSGVKVTERTPTIDRSLQQKNDRSPQVADTQVAPRQKVDRKSYRSPKKKRVNTDWKTLIDNGASLPEKGHKDWSPFLKSARGYYAESLNEDNSNQAENQARWDRCEEHFNSLGFTITKFERTASFRLERVNTKEEKEQGYHMSFDIEPSENVIGDIIQVNEAMEDLDLNFDGNFENSTFEWSTK